MGEPYRNPVTEAVCIAAGWPYCEEHNSQRRLCEDRHVRIEPPKHVYWCEYPYHDCICPAEVKA